MEVNKEITTINVEEKKPNNSNYKSAQKHFDMEIYLRLISLTEIAILV